MLPSGTWCCRSWHCTWHTSRAARAWQHLACRCLRPSLPVLWWQTKLLGMTRQRKQPCEMSACHNLTLSNGLSMTMSWPLSIALHFLSMALAALAKPFSTVACLRAQGRVVVAVASSDIAALLLDGGRSAHSRFKIPVQGLNSTSTCYISRDSKLAALLQAAALIVWDEAVMMHRHVFEAINKSL